jgi:hypothetical protein
VTWIALQGTAGRVIDWTMATDSGEQVSHPATRWIDAKLAAEHDGLIVTTVRSAAAS